ncbi:MAG: type VI secretion system baseplate subunit TssK [Candidatus Electrothrix sp. GW3-4]|uniref:type VI secretion system baseplate subunit TssK n=1 Tax=Candidatus Electrothrix sp. GW3-4 TaxID=3126740 RepID=UPI0030D53EEE
MERPFFWHQGLFLQPQHFQLQDQYIRSLLTPIHSFVQPHFWGVGRMMIQEAALGSLSFQLLQGQFLFPDGSFVVPPENGLVAPRSFNEDWGESGKSLGVLLGLRKWNPAGDNVTVLSSLENIGDVSTRFVSTTEPEEVPDLYQGEAMAQVKRLHYVLKIFWDSEEDELGDYELIPLARLQRHGENIVPSNRFFPPCLSIDAFGPLMKLIADIRDQLASRAHMLEAYKRERGIHTAEFGPRDTVYLLALRSLNRYVPELVHITEARTVHPWTVYGLLRRIIGELSGFSETVNVLGEQEGELLVPPYNHRKLHSCFLSAQDVLLRLLDEITAGPEYMLDLVYDGAYYSGELTPSMFAAPNRFYLVVDTDSEPEPVIRNFTSLAKIGSRESLPLLIARALPGVRMNHLETVPQELPRRAGAYYFQIDHHSDLWQQVQRSNQLAIFWDTAPNDVKIELMVVGRR